MISLPQNPKVVKKEGHKVFFEIEAFYPGYGVTIGNALRRVLLSSLPGAAVTQVKIKNVPHEFSTIPGILEDVISIVLNLKQMRFRLLGEESQIATLKIKGEKEVKASDFTFPSQVELINKDCHIATLTNKSTELEMEIKIEKGIGFVSSEARKKEKREIGVMLLDSIFTPCKRVSIKVENMRVGERTDFDKLLLEIETDGTITPEVAFFKASEILTDHFSFIMEAFRKEAEEKPVLAIKEKKKKVIKKEVKSKQANLKKRKIGIKKYAQKKKGKKTK